MSLYDELTNGPLSAEIAEYITSGNDGAIYEILHRRDIPVKGKLEVRAIYRYLTLIGLRVKIAESNNHACKTARYALADLEPSIDLSNPIYMNKFNEILDGLIDDQTEPLFTSTHKSQLLSMADVMISRVDQLGYQPSIQDIAQALRG